MRGQAGEPLPRLAGHSRGSFRGMGQEAGTELKRQGGKGLLSRRSSRPAWSALCTEELTGAGQGPAASPHGPPLCAQGARGQACWRWAGVTPLGSAQAGLGDDCAWPLINSGALWARQGLGGVRPGALPLPLPGEGGSLCVT